jgi:hypothetical protein
MIARWFMILAGVLFLVQCDGGRVEEREIGYKGKARTNPYLAFERYVQESQGQEIKVQSHWPELGYDQSMILFTAEQLESRFSVDKLDEWVRDGGHAVILMDRASLYQNDWATRPVTPEISEALIEWAKEMEVEVETSSGQNHSKAEFLGDGYEVDLYGKVLLRDADQKAQPVISIERGDGTVTWVADAGLLRNRWIAEKEHIDLIDAMLEWRRDGEIVFLRGVGISFFGLLWQHGWMPLVGLMVVLVAWLMRHLPRFGPMQAVLREDEIRAYDHHLEMIGDFHWRLDRGASLLEPLRAEAQELCYQWQAKHDRLDEGLFDVMASRAEIPVERVERAMTDLNARDNLIFTRMVADLQSIRKAFA